jgi:hypothetical protein
MHDHESYTLVARKRTWVPEWLWKVFCIRLPVFGGLGVIQPFRLILTEKVKPKAKSHHPQCVWCEGKEHHLVPAFEQDSEEVIFSCRHCDYSRPMTEKEADADWDECDFE